MSFWEYCQFGVGLLTIDKRGFFTESVYEVYDDELFINGQPVIYWNRNANDANDATCHAGSAINWQIAPIPAMLISDRAEAARVRVERAREAERMRAERQARKDAREAQIITQEYFIDGLVIVHTQDTGAECASGGDYKIEVRGDIGPDSSFALEELLRRHQIVSGE